VSIELFITRRLAFSKDRSFSRFVVRIAIAAVALSIAVMIVSTSFVSGFQNEISGKIYGFWGHIFITKFGFGRSYEDNSQISGNKINWQFLKSMPNIDRIQPFAYKPGIIKTNDQIEGIVLKGIDRNYNWTFLKSKLVAGTVINFADTEFSRDLLISKVTASRLRLHAGDKVDVNFLQRDAPPLVRRMRICGIYNTGLEEYDVLYALVDIRMIQGLNKWQPDEVSGYEVFLKKYERNDILAFLKESLHLPISAEQADPIIADNDTIYYKALAPELSAQTVQDANPNIFDWLALQNTNKWVILALMLIVATINMITCLLILILERTNMIGTLKALGARNWSIRLIFIYNAVYIISLGMFFGNVLGIGICLVQQHFHLLKLPEESYYVSVAPVDLNWWVVLGINIGTLLICFLVLLIPSWLVSRISPVKAIRFN